ncbi:hypothetical protein Tco_1429887 [Tanacetum coccineum]
MAYVMVPLTKGWVKRFLVDGKRPHLNNRDTVIPAQASLEIPTPSAFQTNDLDAFDSDCDDVHSTKAVLMANLSSYDSDVLSKVPFHDTNIDDIHYQSVQETQCYGQPFFNNNTENDKTSDSNIVSYEQYLQETKNPIVQSTSSPIQQDELLMYVIEEMSSQVVKCNKVADFEKQIHSLKLQLNAIVESHKTLSKTVECLKKESKKKGNKYLEEVIDLQKKNKALDNVVYKMGQPCKQCILPALYDGNTIVKTLIALSITDSEETLELAEEISEHFVKHFVLQKQLSAEQAYWLPISKPVSENPPVPSEPILKKEIPHELPSISLDVKPFAQTLKECFHMFEHGLNKELKEMKAVFNQMETKVAKCFINKKYFEIEKKELSLDNDCLLEQIICQDVMNNVMHANDHYDNVLLVNNNSLDHDNSALDLLKHENDRLMELFISQDFKESFQNSRPSHNHDAPEFKEFFIINELQAQLKAKNVSIEKLKEHIANIKGKNVVESVQNMHNSNVITLKVYKLDLPPLSPCVKNNMAACADYLKHTQENADILCEIVEHARDLRPLDSDLASACKFVTRIQELLVYVSTTCPSSKHVSDKLVVVSPMNRTRKVRVSSSIEASGSKPRSNTKKDRISYSSHSNKKTNKNANFELVCATCHECMFDAIHDLCVSDYLNDVNACVKSKSVKSRSAKSKKKKM